MRRCPYRVHVPVGSAYGCANQAIGRRCPLLAWAFGPASCGPRVNAALGVKEIMKAQDELGDLLRRFYRTYGRPEEGPPDGMNLAEVLPQSGSIQQDSDFLRLCLSNDTARKDFERCRDILEQIATALADSTTFLQELQNLNLPAKPELDNLTNGIFWFTLASQLHPDAKTKSDNLSLPTEIPEPFRRSLQIQGTLVFKLYISLVYMREGVLADILTAGSTARMPTLGLCRKLLNCDYVRHVRNALSHADFSPCMAGIVFRDNGYLCIASPGFLEWLCIWLFTLHYSCMCVFGKE